MNKLTKGAIAGGAGIVLLLGGAGTFALWNDSATVSGGTITAGTLSIDHSTAGTWRDDSYDVTGSPVVNPATFLMVPGDTLTYKQTVTVHATGNHLVGSFGSSYTAGTFPTGVTATVAVKKGATVVANPVTVTDGDVYDVTITLAFAKTTSGLTSQGASVVLNNVNLTLTQVRP